MTAFMPSMQYSIPPWYYNDKTQVPVNKICKEYTDLHENLVYPLLIKYATIATQTGEPIIRPIWWLDNGIFYCLLIFLAFHFVFNWFLI
jgi:alpha-glucosidase (family GH31 glycosyl hydrolase)